MKKTLLLLFSLGFLLLCVYLLYPLTLRAFFLVKGTVEITSELAGRASKPNTMLFLVAKNEGGVPVAVRKIINPVFPLEFQLNPSNLILPDILTKKIYLEAFVNTHGELGAFRNGDLKGSVKSPLFIFNKRVRVVIDTPAKQPVVSGQ